MSRIGLLGGAYTSQSVAVDSQSCVNLVVERDESQAGKSEGILVLRPGLRNFATVFAGGFPVQPGPCGQEIVTPTGRLFTFRNELSVTPVISIYEVFADGSTTYRGSFQGTLGATPIAWAASAQYIAFVNPFTQGLAYFDYTVAGPFTVNAPAALAGIALTQVVFFDAYFLVLKANSAQVFYSLDVTTWNLANTFAPSITADYVRNMIVDHRELWLQGDVDTLVYYDAGDLLNPFQPNPSGFIQQGTGAADSLVQLDNTLFWIGKDPHGQAIGWRANGYVPQRVTTFAVETAWTSYATIADAVGYPVQMQGHSLWVIYFPTANKTWVYDVASGLWGEWNHWKNDGTFEAHRSWVHAFAFGKHLVGDWKTGTIYEMAFGKSNGAGGWLFCDDFGDPIAWQRRLPYVAQENERLFHQILEVDLETGLGPVPPLGDPATLAAPLLQLNNAGTLPAGTWSVIIGQKDANGNIIAFSATSTIVAPAGKTLLINFPDDTAGEWRAYFSNDGFVTGHSTDAYFFAQASINDPTLYPADTPPVVNPRGPTINLRLSDDRGHSYGNFQPRDCGQAGEYSKRVRWTRLGASRFRVYELSGSDPIPWRLIDAYLEAPPGFSKGTPRLIEKLRQQA